ncbi:MAG: hypothetical protein RL757_1172, partial [Bacteroidota bacterium]
KKSTIMLLVCTSTSIISNMENMLMRLQPNYNNQPFSPITLTRIHKTTKIALFRVLYWGVAFLRKYKDYSYCIGIESKIQAEYSKSNTEYFIQTYWGIIPPL